MRNSPAKSSDVFRRWWARKPAAQFAAFKERYAGVEIVYNDLGSAATVVALEKSQNRPQADTAYYFAASALDAAAKGLVEDFEPVNFDKLPEPFRHENGQWFTIHTLNVAFLVNTKLVENVPQSWADLLKPEYKNAIVYQDPRSTGQGQVVVFAAAFGNGGGMDNVQPGIDYLGELTKVGNVLRTVGTTPYAQFLKGEIPIWIGYENDGLKAKYLDGMGDDIAVVMPAEASAAAPYAISLVKNGPNPNAGKLWLNFIMTEKARASSQKVSCVLLFRASPCRKASPASCRKRRSFSRSTSSRRPPGRRKSMLAGRAPSSASNDMRDGLRGICAPQAADWKDSPCLCARLPRSWHRSHFPERWCSASSFCCLWPWCSHRQCDGGSAFSRVWNDPVFWNGLRGSIVLGIAAPFFSLVVGVPVAITLARLSHCFRTSLLIAISLPLTFSGLIVAYGFILLLGRAGFVTLLLAEAGFDPAVIGGFIFSPIGLGLAYSYYLVPRVVLIVLPAIRNFDAVQLRAARSLGAGPLRILVDVLVPQIMPSLVAAFCLTSAVAVGAMARLLRWWARK